MSCDPSRLIAALARDRINLDLKRATCVFLRANRASLASFEEDVLIDMFMQIREVVDPGVVDRRLGGRQSRHHQR
jgi:chromosome partition protein MukF